MLNLTHVPARALTDREITKILCGALGGVAKAGVPMDQAKRVLELYSNFLQSSEAPDGGPEGPWVVVLTGVIGGIAEFCRTADVIRAIGWILQNWTAISASLERAL